MKKNKPRMAPKKIVVPRKKILIVDDDEGILKAVSIFLRTEGYEVRTAEGDEFMADIKDKKHQPDILILDVLLSGIDGRELCKKLKSLKATRDIPILMFSAYPAAEKTVVQAGADAFVSKPFNTDVLLRKIEKLVGRKKRNTHVQI